MRRNLYKVEYERPKKILEELIVQAEDGQEAYDYVQSLLEQAPTNQDIIIKSVKYLGVLVNP